MLLKVSDLSGLQRPAEKIMILPAELENAKPNQRNYNEYED
jgi:hypothetical protein